MLRVISGEKDVYTFKQSLGNAQTFVEFAATKYPQENAEVPFCIAKFSQGLLEGSLPIDLITLFIACMLNDVNGKTNINAEEAALAFMEEFGLVEASGLCIHITSTIMCGTLKKKKGQKALKTMRTFALILAFTKRLSYKLAAGLKSGTTLLCETLKAWWKHIMTYTKRQKSSKRTI